MEQNTYSLLNSPWMIDANHRTSLYPYLIAMMNGNFKGVDGMASYPIAFRSLGVNAWDDDDDEEEEFENDTVSEMSEEGKYIAVLPIKGTIFKYNQYCGPRGIKSMQDTLAGWARDERVIGVVLDIDSGGGQASGLYDFTRYIHNYAKPVVSFVDGYCCSAAYYIGSSAKGGLIVSPGADFIGSIGTMLTYVDMSGILINEGAVIKDIYAEGSPKKNKASRAMDENGDEKLLIKEILNPYRDSFVQSVKTYRPELDDTVFEGDVYLPDAALKIKLVDRLGSMQDAFDKILEMSKPQPSKNSNSNKMSKKTKNLPLLQAVIGVQGDIKLSTTTISRTTGVFITEQQLDAIEAELGQKAQAVTTANSKATVAETKANALNTAVDTAISAAGLTSEVAEGATTEAKITLLQEKVVEYGKQPGAKGSKPMSTGDTFDEEDEGENSTSIYNSLTGK